MIVCSNRHSQTATSITRRHTHAGWAAPVWISAKTKGLRLAPQRTALQNRALNCRNRSDPQPICCGPLIRVHLPSLPPRTSLTPLSPPPTSYFSCSPMSSPESLPRIKERSPKRPNFRRFCTKSALRNRDRRTSAKKDVPKLNLPELDSGEFEEKHVHVGRTATLGQRSL